MSKTLSDSKGLLQDFMQDEKRPMGNLKIFFGYAGGVGKTYAMLDAAHRAKNAGFDVVVGYMESNIASEAMSLQDGLEEMKPVESLQNGILLREFDLDAALQRHPQIILVDKLAHSNTEASRHVKRYQDVEELLRAGIHVYTTVNVQDLESLNDVVSSITGEIVSERIPDYIFDSADQVELVDLDPVDLLERLQASKANQEKQPRYCYSEKELAALRELALRRTADRVARIPVKPSDARPKSGEHILTCLSGAPSNAKVIRTAARMAEAFHGDFTALFVETPDFLEQDRTNQLQIQANLRLAEELGARIATAYGDDPAIQIAEYARVSGVSKVILGRSIQKKTFLTTKQTLMDRLGELAPDLDIYIIPDQRTSRSKTNSFRLSKEHFSVRDLIKTLGILSLCTASGLILTQFGFPSANVNMIFILGVLCISIATFGRIYSVLSSVFSVLIFNFFFTYPYFTLMSNPSYLTTFVVMFIVAILSSSMTTRSKQQAIQSARKAYRTEVLLETSQKLQKAEGEESIIAVTATQLNKLLERSVLFYPVNEEGSLISPMLFPLDKEENMSFCLTPSERAAAKWVLINNKHAGATTGTLPGTKCLYMAVRGMNHVLAVAAIKIDGRSKPDSFEKNLMVAILDECGLALEKESMIRAKQKIEGTARQEALRANLLRSISHDLRTPLTSISGNAGILMGNSAVLDDAKKQSLYGSIYDDAMWLINLVENLLSITRIENGNMKLKMEPELLDEVFQEALAHLTREASSHNLSVNLSDDFLMAEMDARLIVQVIMNIVNNATKYTPP
ncbi:MAG: sensor histidine kinase, partial [Evtepia sp.]|nr:sensor histidine kinase [Evtepia sp.]